MKNIVKENKFTDFILLNILTIIQLKQNNDEWEMNNDIWAPTHVHTIQYIEQTKWYSVILHI